MIKNEYSQLKKTNILNYFKCVALLLRQHYMTAIFNFIYIYFIKFNKQYAGPLAIATQNNMLGIFKKRTNNAMLKYLSIKTNVKLKLYFNNKTANFMKLFALCFAHCLCIGA